MPTFANPAGLWALLGIPAVILIHFLQRKAQMIPVSTLFLLEKTHREASSGRHIDRLTQSVPLWMQLLSVILLSWLLIEPRYPVARSTQRIAVVLDSSASMMVSKDRLIAAMARELPDLQGFASEVEYTVLESTPGKPRMYAGKSLDELLRAMQAWQPASGTTDPTLALRLGRSLVSRDGILIYATDTPTEKLPFEAISLSVGEVIDNVGFTGLSFETKNGDVVWRATLQNYSENNTTRRWQADGDNGSTSSPKDIALPARSVVTLQSSFPRNANRVEIRLSSDEFPIDDTMRLVRPQPKQLKLCSSASLDELSKKLLRSIDQLVTGSAMDADIALVSYDPLDPTPSVGHAVMFVNDGTQGGQYLAGGIIAEKHPLMDGLNWQSLLVRETIPLEIRRNDQVLLRQDQRPLILLREVPAEAERPASQQLMFNFDPRLSNIDNQPAMIVMLLRFIEQIRERKVAASQENLEISQPIRLATSTPITASPVQLLELNKSGETIRTTVVDARMPLTSPDTPGYFRYRQQDQILMETATHFADTREADFRLCGELNQLADAKKISIEAHSTGDPYWHLWVLLLVALLLISWFFTRERDRMSTPH